MQNLKTQISLVAILILVLAALTLAQDSYRLEYKFQKGKTYRYSNSSSGSMTQEMMGKEMKMANSTSTTVRMVVDSILKDGSFVLIVSADSAKVSSKSQMMDTTMNLDNMIGKRTKLTISKIGKILATEVIDSIKSVGQFGGSVQRQLSGLSKLTEKEVKIGDKWKIASLDTIASMGGKIYHTSNLEFTLIGKEKKQGHECLKIDYVGTTSDTGKMMMGGMELFVEGNGKVKGTIYFDQQQGLTVYDESTSDTEQTMAVTGQQNMTIPVSQSMKSIRALLEN